MSFLRTHLAVHSANLTAAAGGGTVLELHTAAVLQVELPPFVYLPPPTYFESRRCIGWDSACNWPNISAYIDSGAGDTDEYILTGLNITLPTASQVWSAVWIRTGRICPWYLQALQALLLYALTV